MAAWRDRPTPSTLSLWSTGKGGQREVTRSAEITDLQTRQYLTLLELSKAIASHRDLADLFHDLAGRLHNLFDFHNLAVILHDGSRNVMRMHILEPRQPAMQEFLAELPIDGSIA